MPLLQRTPQDRRQEICREYKMEATIQNKMRLDKCDAYTVKETLGYRGENPICQQQEEQQKQKKNREGQENKQIYSQITGVP